MRVENVKIEKIITMNRYLTSIFFLLLIIVGGIELWGQNTDNSDIIYIKIPSAYDTVSVKKIDPNLMCIVLDRNDLNGFKAPGAISFYIPRETSKFIKNGQIFVNRHAISYSSLSDSLIHSKRDFFKRHTFFVIITRNDTSFFYHAKGEYMYRNYNGEIKYDTIPKKHA